MRYLLTVLLGLLTVGIFFSCQKELSLEYGTPAKGMLQSDLTGDCTPKPVLGSFVAGKALTDSNYVEATVIVTAPGPYTIYTDTVNGYSFKATGTFSAVGTNTVKLKGNGTPAANGIDDFSVFFDADTCAISVTVQPAGSAGGCNPGLQGTYMAGTAMTATNTVVLSHSYTTAGSYTVSTDTINGYHFGPTSHTATTGANTITLTAIGTPTAAGTNNFTVKFGDGQTCTFTVTVNPSGTTPTGDLFPLTQGSWWSYDDGGLSPDTLRVTNNGTGSFGGNTYQRFIRTDGVTPVDTLYFRKDAAGNYFESGSTDAFSFLVAFSQPRIEVLFLKENASTGATWQNDYPVTFLGVPSTLRFKYEVKGTGLSRTINGKSFTNVVDVELDVQLGIVGGTPTSQEKHRFYYVRGIGRVEYYDLPFDTDLSIRYWKVN